MRLDPFIRGGRCLWGWLLVMFAGWVSAVDVMVWGAESRPNVVVILADDLGRADYSGFGTKEIRTPNIDRIAAGGMTFKNFYANSCVCSPTRAALLTGCYPDRVGVPGVIREEEPSNSWGYLSRRAVLLPERLRTAGYHSAIVGKWHLGIHSPNTPNERGFDEFRGFLGDMMDDYWTHRRHGQNFMRRNAQPIDPKGHATDLFTEWACSYLEERALAKSPFFLYLAYNAPHGPIQPPEEWLRRVQEREPGLGERRAKFVALTEHMDAGIGKVLDTLERLDLSDNTLVMFTSDNGGSLPEGGTSGPWRSGKQHMYEGGIRVPAMVRWPGRVKAGSVTDRAAMSMDVFASVCEAAGVGVGDGAGRIRPDAVSFLPTVLGRDQGPLREEMYFVRREGGLTYMGKTIEAVIRGEWKMVFDSPFAPGELYHLGRDPREERDVAGVEKALFREMGASLRKHLQRGGTVPWQAPE
jgi:arylsulfatase A-like enzyme